MSRGRFHVGDQAAPVLRSAQPSGGLFGTVDFNRDALINSQDFFDFLAAFFAGC